MSKCVAKIPGFRVALADYDDRRLATLSRILRGYSRVTGCVGYRSGRELLRDLQAGEEYRVILLGRELLDMDAGEFFTQCRSLRIPYPPTLAAMDPAPGLDPLELELRRGEDHGWIDTHEIESVCRIVEALGYSQEAQVEELCAQLYREWQVTSESRNCEHMTRLMQMAVRYPRENDLRKGLMIPIKEQSGVSVSAQETGLARVRDAAEAQCTAAWQGLLQRWGCGQERQKKLEPKEFIRIVRSELLYRIAQSWKERDGSIETNDTRSPVGG